MEHIQRFFNSSIGHFVLGVILILAAWLVASVVRWIFNNALQKTGLSRKLADWGVVKEPDRAANLISTFGQVLYALVWVFFLPGILEQFGLHSLATPITNMMNSIVAFIPRLLGAAVYVLLGVLVARIVKHLVYNLALGLNVDKWSEKLQLSGDVAAREKETRRYSLANVLGNIAFALVIIPFIIPALEALEMHSITAPIVNILNTILSAIPNILVAAVLVFVGVLIAKFVSNILHGLLENTGINQVNNFLSDDGSVKVNFAKLISEIVAVVIIIFFAVEALSALNLPVLSTIGASVIAYLPSVIAALAILVAGLLGGAALAKFIRNNLGSQILGNLVQGILGVFAVFMALNQLGIATDIVNKAFVLIVGAVAVAFAIAFGLGGRDFASKQLDKLEKTVDNEAEKVKSTTAKNNDENTEL